MPAFPGRNVPNCRPMVDGGMRKCSAGLVPRWGRGGAWQNPLCQLAIPNHNSGFSHLGAAATAGMCDCYENRLPPLNSSFVRKHVPDSDPGCALQSTSMPALHRRNVPNCRPMVDGGMRKCSAGACPPLGSGWGVAESTVPTRHTKSQLRVFTPCRAGPCLHERLLRKHIPDSDPGCALQSTSMPALHRRNLPNCRPMVDGGMRKCSAVEDFARRGACPPLGSRWGVAEPTVPTRRTKPQLRLFIPWRAGTSRHERLLRKHIPDQDPG